MCGIVGTVGPGSGRRGRRCSGCATPSRHRGPDDWGTFVEGGDRASACAGSASSTWPAATSRSRTRTAPCVVVFNGEIYNHEALHARAGGRRDTASAPGRDTEVLVHLYEEHGERMVARLRGMFAFALWDRRRRRLLLARDHFGQKPLFYTEQGGRLTFASEIKALLARRSRAWPSCRPFALDQYLTLRFVQPPDTFFERHPRAAAGALPGLGERRRADRALLGPELRAQVAATPRPRRSERIDELLAETVTLHLHERRAGRRLPERRARLHADRLVRREGARLRAPHVLDGHPVPRPERAARRRGGGARGTAPGTSPRRSRPAWSTICPRLVSALDEPADPLSICLLHLARMTAAPGEGRARRRRRRRAVRRLRPLRRRSLARRLSRGAARRSANLVASQVLDRLPDQFTFKSLTHKLRWVDLMARKTGGERYAESLQFFWFNEAHRAELYTPGFRAQLRGRRPEACLLDLYATTKADDPIDRMMYVDMMSRLPGQSLMILDRATMAYSLESRSPFLDPRFAEFMARVPVRAQDPRPAAPLPRAPAGRALPAAARCCDRKKQGFASPLMYIMDEEVRTLAPRAAASTASWCATGTSRRARCAAGGRAPDAAPRPRQPDLAAAERRGLVPAVHRRPDARSRSRDRARREPAEPGACSCGTRS